MLCAKRRYRTKKEAKRIIKSIRRTRGDGEYLKAYRCVRCLGWHVGHMPGCRSIRWRLAQGIREDV